VVKKLVVFVALAALVLAAAACGGDDDGNRPSGNLPTVKPSATRAPGAPASIAVDPKSAPPGAELTVSGAGFPPGVTVSVTADVPAEAPTPGTVVAPKPYATAMTAGDGTFMVTFRLEKSPTGGDLKVGRLDIVARASGVEAKTLFLVETRRPVGGPITGG
jgi:hypothetical protein